MMDALILLGGAIAIVLVYAIVMLLRDSWCRQCVDCRRHLAVFAYQRCFWHRVHQVPRVRQ